MKKGENLKGTEHVSPTCPSAIMTRTWYCPLLFSTMSIAASIIGANEVGPVNKETKIITSGFAPCWNYKNQV